MQVSKFAASALIALASVAATSAFAGNDNNYPVLSANGTSLSRTEVRAQVAQARQDGTLMVSDDKQYPQIANTGSKTREQVKAELQAAIKAGEIVRVRG